MPKDYKDLPKAYDASLIEDQIYNDWEEGKYFKPDLSLDKEAYSIAMPPPNATGTLHLGHATMLAFEDLMIRYNRMLGKPTLWLPGTDHAAIATQSVVERKLQKKGIKKPRKELGREKLIEEIKEFVKESQSIIKNQVRKMGASCDWEEEKYTLDEGLNKAVNTFFQAMYEDDLIYRGNRIVNWDPNMQTTVADDELEYVEGKTKFYYFQYGPVVIGTARPETKFLDKVIVVHPDDKRYKDLIGKEFDVEWIEGTIKAKVIADSCIDMEMGTGAMTITPAHSLIDFELAEKYNLDVEQIIDFNGKIREEVSKEFGGLDILEARKKIVEKLDKKGLVVEIDEKYINKKAVNYRGKGIIEPQIMKQWFIDVNKKVVDWKGKNSSLKEVMQDVVRSGMIKILPERFEKTYFHWIDNLRDWCISRQIWWGHQIPIWYKVTEEQYNELSKIKDASSFTLQTLGGEQEARYGVEKPDEEGFWFQDPDTLDTWFSSGLWTFSTLGWPEKTDKLMKFHPTDVLETGYDILFFWVARMILASTYALRRDGFPEEKCIPFKTVYLHGMIRDRDGKKMSKSRPETCINPLDMIEKYGVDSLRLSLLIGSSPGNDMRLYEEKIAGYRNFVNKIWNISRFVLMSTEFTNEDPKPETYADYWILNKLEELIKFVTISLKDYDFSSAGERVYEFLWNEFANWYVEIAKIEEGKDAILRFVLKNSLKLLHPFIPFITEYIWELGKFSDKKLIVETWPEYNIEDKKDLIHFETIRNLISSIRKERAYFKIAPKNLLKLVIKKGDLKEEEKIFKRLARISQVEYDSEYISKKGDILISENEIDMYLILEDEIDIDQMLEKLNTDINELIDFQKRLKGKLSNKKFVDNAPKEIVKTEEDKLQEVEDKLNKFQKRISQLNC